MDNILRVLNKKYWPARVRTNMISDKEDEAYKWCLENMPGNQRWILAGPNNWYFNKEKDAIMFRLRWCDAG